MSITDAVKPSTDEQLAELDEQLAYMASGPSECPEYTYAEVAALRERLRQAEYALDVQHKRAINALERLRLAESERDHQANLHRIAVQAAEYLGRKLADQAACGAHAERAIANIND